MKVLVIDDTSVHLDAALQTLDGHNVTICSNHEEARKLLATHQWDAVLCDLLMPAGGYMQGPDGQKFVGQEMAVGWALALTAAQNGVKYVAVVTDMNHHNHPGSAMLDPFSKHVFTIDGARVLMTNEGGMVGIAGTEFACEECSGTGKARRRDGSPYECCYCRGGGVKHKDKGKNWGEILKALLSDDKEYHG